MKYSSLLIVTAAVLLTGCADNNTISTPNAATDVSDALISADASADVTSPAESAAEVMSQEDPGSTSELPSENTNAVISVDYADGVDSAGYDEFNVNASEFQTLVMFSTNIPVTDFKVLSLTYQDSDEDGNITFDIQTLYTQETLTPERPLVAGLEFIGTIPNNGISYVDQDGTVRTFAVDMSGMDGSLFLWEI